MKAVILAAGKSTRTHPLTVDVPKVMIKVAGKPILQHKIETLKGIVSEAILVVGYRKDVIQRAFGKEFRGIRLTYVEQKEQLGTGHALLSAERLLKDGDFIVMMGDDMYSERGMKALMVKTPSLLGQQVDDPSSFGVWLEENGNVSGYQEKPDKPRSNMANTGLYVLGPEVFPYIKNLSKTVRGEYELNEAVSNLAKEKPIRIVRSDGDWIPVGYPWNLLDANQILLDKMDPVKEGDVEDGAVIRGKVSVGRGTRILSGSYIEGPAMIGRDCLIGPNCYIRPYTSIGDNCRIGNASEVKNSIIGDGTRIPHLNYVGDSLIGRNVGLGASTLTCNLRHDRGIIKSSIKGRLVGTGRNKFGTVIGDGVKLGARTTIYPGRKIWPGKTTLPGEVVRKDIR